MKDVPVQHSYMEDVDEAPVSPDFVMRIRTPPNRKASSALRLAPKATKTTAESVLKEEDRVELEKFDDLSTTPSGRSNQENTSPHNMESRDPPPTDLVAQDGSFAELEHSPIERTYTNFVNQVDFPAEQQNGDSLSRHTAVDDEAVALDEASASTDARESSGQIEASDSVVTEVSVKRKNKLKLFRLIPGILDVAARRKNQMAEARERRRILEEKRTGKKKRGFLKRPSMADADPILDESQGRTVEVQVPTKRDQPSGLSNHEISRNAEGVEQSGHEEFPSTTIHFTKEEVEQFVNEKAASLAYVELTNFDALYQTFISSLQNGKVEQDQVLRQLSLGSEGRAAFSEAQSRGDDDEHGDVVNVASVSSALEQTTEQSIEGEPILACASSTLELSVGQLSQVEPRADEALVGPVQSDMSMDSSTFGKGRDGASAKSTASGAIWENSILESSVNWREESSPDTCDKKPVVIGRAIKGRGRERKWFDAIGIKGRAKSLAIALEPSNTESSNGKSSMDSLEETCGEEADANSVGSELVEKKSLDSKSDETKSGRFSEAGDVSEKVDELRNASDIYPAVSNEDSDIKDSDINALLLKLEEIKNYALNGYDDKGPNIIDEDALGAPLQSEMVEGSLSNWSSKESSSIFDIGSKELLHQEGDTDKNIGSFGLTGADQIPLDDEEATEPQKSGAYSLPPMKKGSKQNKKNLGLSLFGKKTDAKLASTTEPIPLDKAQSTSSYHQVRESKRNTKASDSARQKKEGKKSDAKGASPTVPGRSIPLEKVISTPAYPRARDVKRNTKVVDSARDKKEEAKRMRRSVTYAKSSGDLILPTLQMKPPQASAGTKEIQEVEKAQAPLLATESRDAKQSMSEDESTNNRQSLLDNETFDSYVSDLFEDGDDDEDSISLGGDCKSYSNFLDWVGHWLLPLGGSRVCVPVDEDKHVSDYAPQLKAVVAVGVETMNSFGSNIPGHMTYEELDKIEIGVCNDVKMLTSGLDLIAKLEKKAK